MTDPDDPAELARKVRTLAADTRSPNVRAALLNMADEAEALASTNTRTGAKAEPKV